MGSSKIDWTVISAAVAVFVGTLFTTVYGWFHGKVEFDKKLKAAQSLGTPTPGTESNEYVIVTRELRDRIYLNSHFLEENNDLLRELIDEFRQIHQGHDQLTG